MSIKAFKAFHDDMTCHGFKYEIGKEYEEPNAVLCKKGFHACEQPLDVLQYYPAAGSRFCEVSLDGDVKKASDDTKCVATKIKIGGEIGIQGLCKAQFEYVKDHTNFENTDPKQATAGDWGAATAGDSGAATAGDRGFSLSGGTSAVGKGGVAVARGENPRAKGGMDATLVLVLTDDDGKAVNTKTVTVDGESIKPDTWYSIEAEADKVVESDE